MANEFTPTIDDEIESARRAQAWSEMDFLTHQKEITSQTEQTLAQAAREALESLDYFYKQESRILDDLRFASMTREDDYARVGKLKLRIDSLRAALKAHDAQDNDNARLFHEQLDQTESNRRLFPGNSQS